MKKLFLGALLFCGLIGILVLIVLSVQHPWSYNGVSGFQGFLLGSEMLWAFILFCIMSVAGIIISFLETYAADIKNYLKTVWG